MAQHLLTQLANGGNLVLQVTADDLRDVMKSFYHEEKVRTEEAIRKNRELPTIDRREACKILGVTNTTLWKWAKEGSLVPCKIGSKVLYKASDIEEFINRRYNG